MNKNIDELVALVKRNRARRRAMREQRINENARQSGDDFDGCEPKEDEEDFSGVKVVLFAVENPFTQSIMAMIRRYTVARQMWDSEETLTFCADYEIDNVILDLDPPSDCDSARDVFAALKIIRPGANVFVCSKNTGSLDSRSLVGRGGIRLNKPLLFKDLERFVRQYVKK